MGTIYQARDLVRGIHVALKLLGAACPLAQERLRIEVTALSQLRHPGVVAYVAHGQVPDGRPFLAMEWVDGEDLAIRLQRGPLPLDEVVALLASTAQALSAVHAHSVIHRDIKPSNIMLRGGHVTTVALLDFGIAEYADRQRPLTPRGRVVGTPGYMAPEQARGEATLTPRADLFALGCVLYECLTGQPPFAGVHTAEVLTQTLFSEPVPIRLLRADTPPWLEVLIGALLRKDPAERPADLESAALAAKDMPGAGQVSGRRRAPERERQLIAVVAAYPIFGAETLAEHPVDEDAARCATSQTSPSALVEWFLAGAEVAALPTTGNAVDQAEAALGHGLELARRWPGARVALAMGPAALSPHRAFGGPVERALALVHETEQPAERRQAILLDGLSARLLCGRHQEHDTAAPRGPSFVGRSRELRLLDGRLRACAEGREAQLLFISASPGGGKTRLWQEWAARLGRWSTPVTVLTGRAAMMTDGAPYNVLRNLLRTWLGSTEPRQVLAVLARWVAHDQVQRLAPFIGELAGLPLLVGESPILRSARDDPRIMREQVQQALLELLRGLCKAGPVVLILDDMQWSDRMSQQLLADALTALHDCPLFILALGRPESLSRQPLGSRGARHVMLPLSRAACQVLIRGQLGASADQGLIAEICERSGGNAFFLTELVRDAADGRRAWPETVVAMLQARISSQDLAARRVLLSASVLGTSFQGAALSAVTSGDPGPSVVERALAAQIRAGVLANASGDGGEDRALFRFRHDLWREAAYALVPTDVRREWHRRAADHLAALAAPEPQVVAEHYYLGDEPRMAVPWYLSAAERGLTSLSLEAVRGHIERARACGPDAREEALLDAIQTEALSLGGDFGAAYPICARALSRLRPGERWWSACAVRMAALAAMAGRAEDLPALVEQLMTTSVDDEARFYLGRALVMMALSCGLVGARGRMEHLVQRAKEVCRPIEQEHAALRGETQLAQSLYFQMMGDDPWRAWQLAQASIAASEQAGASELRVRSRAALIQSTIDLGEYEEAARLGREVVAETRRRGLALIELVSLSYLAQALVRWGTPDSEPEAAQAVDEALALARRSANRVYEGLALITAGELHARRAQGAIAVSLLEQALDRLRVCPGLRPRVLWPLIRVLLREDGVAPATLLAQESLRALEWLGAQGETTIHLHLGIAAVCAKQGDGEGARRALGSAHSVILEHAGHIPEPTARSNYLRRIKENRLVLAAHASPHFDAATLLEL